MTELSPEARRLLGLARRGDDPLDADRARCSHHVARRLAMAASVTSTALGTAKVASGAAATSVLLGKGLVTGVLLTLTAVGTWKAAEHGDFWDQAASVVVSGRHRPKADGRTMPAATATSPEATPPSEPTPRLEVASSAASGDRFEAAPTTDFETTPTVTSTAVPDVVAANRPRRLQQKPESRDLLAAPTSSAPDPLAAEAFALRQAQQAMSAGQAERALSLVAEQDRRFRGGVLVQERAAARIFALCSLGRVAEAREQARTFERRWPRSPLISRVRRGCDSEASP
jgi:hypothetical protein